MINTLLTLLIWLLVFGMGIVEVHAAEEKGQWPRFRGPNGSGISEAKGIPIKWTAKDYNWTTKLHGDGSSSPVLWGQYLFVTCNDRKKSIRSIVCVNANDGKIRWHRDYPYRSYRMHRDNDFASSTPVVDREGVVVTWSTPKQLLLSLIHI